MLAFSGPLLMTRPLSRRNTEKYFPTCINYFCHIANKGSVQNVLRKTLWAFQVPLNEENNFLSKVDFFLSVTYLSLFPRFQNLIFILSCCIFKWLNTADKLFRESWKCFQIYKETHFSHLSAKHFLNWSFFMPRSSGN